MYLAIIKSFFIKLLAFLIFVFTSTNFLFSSKSLEEFSTTVNIIFDNGTLMIYLGSKDGIQKNVRYIAFKDEKEIGELEFFEVGYWYSKAKVVRMKEVFKEGNSYAFKLKEPLKKETIAPSKPILAPKKQPVAEEKPKITPITPIIKLSPTPPSKKQKNSFLYTMIQYENQSSDLNSDDFIHTTLLYAIMHNKKSITSLTYNYINSLSDSENSNSNIGVSFTRLFTQNLKASTGINYFTDTKKFQKSNSYFLRCDLTFPSFIPKSKFNFYPIYDKKDIRLLKLNIDHIFPISNEMSFDLISSLTFDLESDKNYKTYQGGTNLSYKVNKKTKLSIGYRYIKVKFNVESPKSYNISSLRFSILKRL